MFKKKHYIRLKTNDTNEYVLDYNGYKEIGKLFSSGHIEQCGEVLNPNTDIETDIELFESMEWLETKKQYEDIVNKDKEDADKIKLSERLVWTGIIIINYVPTLQELKDSKIQQISQESFNHEFKFCPDYKVKNALRGNVYDSVTNSKILDFGGVLCRTEFYRVNTLIDEFVDQGSYDLNNRELFNINAEWPIWE